jgi:hypothetical protein
MQFVLENIRRLCCRRCRQVDQPLNMNQHFDIADVNQDNDEWQLIPAPVTNVRFRSTVKKIIKLLRYRRIFAHAGHWLQTVGRTQRGSQLYQHYSSIFTSWPRTLLKGTSVLFNHLERRHGVLCYR